MKTPCMTIESVVITDLGLILVEFLEPVGSGCLLDCGCTASRVCVSSGQVLPKQLETDAAQGDREAKPAPGGSLHPGKQ